MEQFTLFFYKPLRGFEKRKQPNPDYTHINLAPFESFP